jgi:hypothetical protein
LEGDNILSTITVSRKGYIREEISKRFGESTEIRQFGSGICEESLQNCDTFSRNKGSSGEALILKPIRDRFRRQN